LGSGDGYLSAVSSRTETIVASYDALNKGDIDAAMSVLAEDAEWHESGELPDSEGHYIGREAICSFLTEFLASWDRFHQEVEEIREAGDRLGVFIHLTATGRGSSAEVDARYAHVWRLNEDGLGVRVDAFYYRDNAEAELAKP
jgi:ketosteroid isomerase-like protein